MKVRRILSLVLLLVWGVFAYACVKQQPGETPEQYKNRKKAIYSAQLVTGLAGMTDMAEIFVESEVAEKATGRTLVDIDERALGAADVLRERLKAGWDASAIEKVRQTIADVEAARKAGTITFRSAKAQAFYFDALATTEVSLNLIEALQNGTKEPNAREAGGQAMDTLRAGSDEPKWWNRAIVKATEIARIIASQSNMDTAKAWADADERSKALHIKNKALLEAWK